MERREEGVRALVKAGVDIITLDSAHGHSAGVLAKVAEVRKERERE